MKRTRDPLYRCARQVWQHLSLRAAGRDRRLKEQLHHLADSCHALSRRRSTLACAERHGWALAADKIRAQMLQDVHRVQRAAADLIQFQRADEIDSPPLRAILDDLRELASEFEGTKLNPQEELIVVRTESIELEGIELGPFAIELHLARLGRDAGSGCFKCIALEPNSAANNASITHPHVSDGTLCAGEATGPIRVALLQGRISDAFLLVAGVLRTYNAESPYVSLDQWQGAACPECGGSVRRSDELCFCEGCNRDVCDDCTSRCAICEDSYGSSCLEWDPVSDRSCCPHCRQTCQTCNRIVDTDTFDDSSGLCPQCLEAASEEESPPSQPEEPVNENPEPNNASPVPPVTESASVAAA
jgi:hypothetical protein